MKIWKLSVVIFVVSATLAMGLPVIPTQQISHGLAPTPPSPARTTKTLSDDDQFPESVSANKKLMKQYLSAHPNELKEFTDYGTEHKKAELDLKEIAKEGSSSDMKELLGITPDADQQKENEQWSEGMKEVASEIQKGLQSREAAGNASPSQAVKIPVPMAVNNSGPNLASIPPAITPTGVTPTGVSLPTPSLINLTAALKVSLGSLGSQVSDPKGMMASLVPTVLRKQIGQILPVSQSGILPPPSGSTASLAPDKNGQMQVHN